RHKREWHQLLKVATFYEGKFECAVQTLVSDKVLILFRKTVCMRDVPNGCQIEMRLLLQIPRRLWPVIQDAPCQRSQLLSIAFDVNKLRILFGRSKARFHSSSTKQVSGNIFSDLHLARLLIANPCSEIKKLNPECLSNWSQQPRVWEQVHATTQQ